MAKQAQLKQQVAEAALSYVEPGMVIGVGTGSTVDCFIEALSSMRGKIEGAVSSSKRTTDALKKHSIMVLDLNSTGDIPIYFDGADEVNRQRQMIKGGGGALTGEKIVATAARKFVCLVDESKLVDRLGNFPIAVEVLPMARSLVGRHLVKLGGSPEYRHGFVTDHGNYILDVFNLDLSDIFAMELALNQIPGVVCHGLFATRAADEVLVASSEGVTSLAS